MARGIYPEYPPDLAGPNRQFLIESLKDWSIAHGLAVRPPASFVSTNVDPEGVLAATAPVTLFPSLFPKSCFDEGLRIQLAYNKLYAAIARDEEWLVPIIEEIAEIDSFVSDLLKVHLADLSLGLFRSDYMVHVDPSGNSSKPGIKQVEFNTIASSFGGLSVGVSALHKHLLAIGAYPPETKCIKEQDALPASRSVPSLAIGLAAAHTEYSPSTNNPSCVIFLVQYPERNVFDQRHLEYRLLETHGIRTFRLPFDRIAQDTELTADRTLLYRPPHAPDAPFEVSTVYFRAGYTPSDYRGPEDWNARIHLERSRAIKCPSVLTQLAGCKKIQQVLATPASPHLARFLPDKTEAASVAATFAPIYPMDVSEAGRQARTLATDPEKAVHYVLKPQREGGGNNVYRKSIPGFLEDLDESAWPAYILMEMIEPPAQRNVILRNGEIQKGGVICELGVYGVCLWRHGGEILKNWEAGYLLRTKGDQSEEGGVAAGFGAVDSVCLVEV
ncbi:glutathione synthetase-like protein [Trichodelitschia bisporula]|uniref:Glutathione synthetase n=1 Tax=Trichodelitschia bisporula TaxID=703511 RepID=A0A6G1I7Y0_9PEZI|nr:glutathione synthetase-like protein [Trichodelitschia bisporula]